MKRTLALPAVALLALTACSSGDDEPESAPATTESVQAESTSEDPFEDIPDDAPIHDMDEDDIAQHFLDCDDGLSAEECQQQYEAEIEAESIERSIEECQDYIEESQDGGWVVGGCFNYTMTNAEFYQVFEERTGQAVPEELREPDPTCDELADELAEAVSDYNRDPQSASAEWAVENVEGRITMHGCDDEVDQLMQADPTDSADGSLPDASEVDLYGPISHPSELQVKIDTLEDCESAHIIWGGLMNGELEGFDIDTDYLSELEGWMDNNGCWQY